MGRIAQAARSLPRRARALRGRKTDEGAPREAADSPAGLDHRPLTSNEVEQYYDEWHDRYIEGFGAVLQTFRSREPNDFLLELAALAGFHKGQRVVDAGCGVCGPALLFAERCGVSVEGVTVSGAQERDARRRIAERGLSDRVRVHKGDFHHLEEIFAPASMDAVYFLEAFCHSDHPAVVLASVATVLKPGGTLFIKDLFRNRGATPDEEADIEVAVRNTEHHCHLNVWPRGVVTDAITAAGFEIELDQPFELFPDFDYDTGNDFVERNGVDIFEGRPSTYLEHAAIRARKPEDEHGSGGQTTALGPRSPGPASALP